MSEKIDKVFSILQNYNIRHDFWHRHQVKHILSRIDDVDIIEQIGMAELPQIINLLYYKYGGKYRLIDIGGDCMFRFGETNVANVSYLATYIHFLNITNGTLTIEFQSSDVITECTLSRFDPDDVDGLSDLSSVKPWNSVDLIFGDSCFTEFHDKFAIDSSKVYFKNAASFGIGIYVYFYNEGDSLPSTSNLSALTQMTAEPNGDGWYGAPADFTKEKVAFYGKDGNQNNSGWTIECDLIEGKIFFKAAGEKNTSGSNSGKYNMESFSSIKDALSKDGVCKIPFKAFYAEEVGYFENFDGCYVEIIKC